jgi:protein-tyrosine phosphatase
MPHETDWGEVSVFRDSSGEFEIRWENPDSPVPVAIYAGPDPEQMVRVAGPDVMDAARVRINGLEPRFRYYFKLCGKDGSFRIAAERRVPLQGAVNFRDLGGYRTIEGRRVKWGRVFRSDRLSGLADGDLAVFGQLGIRHVFDFRSEAEVAVDPNRLPTEPPVDYLNLPVSRGEFNVMDAIERIRSGDISWMSPEFMVEGYIGNLESHGRTWGEVIRRIAAEGEGAVLFHCTGGKDRTGICAALILLVLGVAKELVIWDHQFSNACIADVVSQINRQVADWGVDPEPLQPFFTAPREAIVAALDHIFTRYGSAEAYLRAKAGLAESEIEKLRTALLETPCR